MYLGDYTAGATVSFDFNTVAFSDGSPVTLAGTPSLAVYKNSPTQSSAGVTLTVDYDSITGMHHVVVDTSADGAFYAAGNDFSVVIAAGTVGGTSVIGRKVGSFSIENRCQKAQLTSTGLDAISGTAPTGLAATFKDKLLQVWERWFGKVVEDDNALTIKVMQGSGSVAQTTQTFTNAGGIKTVNKAT